MEDKTIGDSFQFLFIVSDSFIIFSYCFKSVELNMLH